MATAASSKEIQIPVPWGTIAAKTWGHSTNPIVLLFHGLEDNANTFDVLVPQLPLDYYYISIDLPGHGKSDFLPSIGLPLQGMDYVYVIKILTDHFGKEKYIIIGHSFGAILGTQFGFVYPEKIDKLFILDTIWFELVQPSNFGSWTRNKFEEFTKIQNQIKRNSEVHFTYKQALDIMSSWRNTNCELTTKAAEILLERSTKKTGDDKFKFTRDPKLKNYLCYPVDERYACEVVKSHKFSYKVVVVITRNSEKLYEEKYPHLVKEYKRIGEWFCVEGNHHVHLNNPSAISGIINDILDDGYPI